MQEIDFNMDNLILKIQDFAIDIIVAILILIIGRILIKLLAKQIGKNFDKKDFEKTKSRFLLNIISAILNLILFGTIAGVLGISTSSIFALIGSAGLAIGLALQGSLSNLAGGFLLMINKPFKKGDFIEAQGISGSVEDINILNTKFITPDNKVIYVPNAPLSGGNIINYSEMEDRRLDLVFGIGYSDDINKAKEILQNIMETEDRILKDKNNQIFVSQLADSSVNISFRAWVKAENYWPLNGDLHQKVKHLFDENGVSIPFPQTDVHLYKNN